MNRPTVFHQQDIVFLTLVSVAAASAGAEAVAAAPEDAHFWALTAVCLALGTLMVVATVLIAGVAFRREFAVTHEDEESRGGRRRLYVPTPKTPARAIPILADDNGGVNEDAMAIVNS